MACLAPVRVFYWDRLGDSNVPVVDYRSGELYSATRTEALVPCGRCVCCKRRTQNDWMIRSFMHSHDFPQSVFATLTYNDFHLPRRYVYLKGRSSSYRKRVGTLRRSDVRSWLKRCRIRFFRATGRRVSYFYVGEYGPKTFRPHYHIIVYGLSLSEFCRYFRRDWELHFGFVRKPRATRFNDGCFSYIGKYCCKPEELEIPYVVSKQVEVPRKVASNNFGIWYVNKNSDWHLALDVGSHDKRFVSFSEVAPDGSRRLVSGVVGERAVRASSRCFVDFNGYRYALPSYYGRKIFGSSVHDLTALAFRREKALYARSQLSSGLDLQRAMWFYFNGSVKSELDYFAWLDEGFESTRKKSLRVLSSYYERSYD